MIVLKKLNILCIIFLCIACLISLSCVCAADCGNSTATGDILGMPHDYDLNHNGGNDYLDLKDDMAMLHDGDTYDFNRNYSFEKWHPLVKFNYGIDIYANNVTINGNGYAINANNVSAIFNVHGNNVAIKNLTIVDAVARYSNYSPIVWEGNNGILANCTIRDCFANVGGALKWTGNNALIQDVAFINCSSKYVGGALYIGGTNNTVNSVFLNCTSKWSQDAIYIDRDRKNCTINSIHNNDGIFDIDGKYTNLDIIRFVDLHYIYPVLDNTIDITPLLYRAFVYGGVNQIDEKISYYGWYVNSTEFIMTFKSNFDNDIVYQKNLYFHDVKSTDDLFWKLYSSKFDYDHRFIKSITIRNMSDYESLCSLLKDDKIFKSEINTLFGQSDSVVKALNVTFAGAYNFESKLGFVLDNPNIDVVNVYGNGSTISGKADSSDSYKWAQIKKNKYLSISNLNVKRFNTAIENLGGVCFLNNMVLSENKMDYTFDRDWGAGILNAGSCYCYNCSFLNNYAKNGGAIFNQGFISLYNSTFNGNTAYNSDSNINHKGNDICVGDGGKVQIDGKNITSDTNQVFFAKSISSTRATVLTIVTIAGAFVAGFVAGILSFNPLVGFAVGAAAGAGIGALGAGVLISSHYDINYNRMSTCICLIVGGAIAGGLGGIAGYYATAAGSASAASANSGSVAGQGAAGSNAGMQVSQNGHIVIHGVNPETNLPVHQHVVQLAGHAAENAGSCTRCCVRFLF